MRSDVIILPNDVANTGKRHAAIRTGDAADAPFVPRVAPHADPGALAGEFTWRYTIAATTAARLAVLFNPPGSGVVLEVVCARWKFLVTVAQATTLWNANVYINVPAITANLPQTYILPGRGEAQARAGQVNVEAATAAATWALRQQVPFFKEALAVSSAGARDIALIEEGAAPLLLKEGDVLALDVKAAAAASQFEAQLALSWREWRP